MVLRYQDVRLSEHFTMLDFVQCRTLREAGVPLPAAEALTPRVVACGEALCADILEPLVQWYGPCSVSSGWRPEAVAPAGFRTPHRWGVPGQGGQGADVCFHEQVNRGTAPATTCRDVIESGYVFNRLITYAGSEFVCVSCGGGDRGAFYENILRKDGSKFYKPWCHHRGMWPDFLASDHCRRRPDWRLREGQASPHYDRTVQPQHVRVGRYFTFLDFCRSEEALLAGARWAPDPERSPAQVAYARMAAEILGPAVAAVGRLCVTAGLDSVGLCGDPRLWWSGGEALVRFLPPASADVGKVLDAVSAHPSTTHADAAPHPAGTEVTVTFDPFEPATTWTSRAPALARRVVRQAA